MIAKRKNSVSPLDFSQPELIQQLQRRIHNVETGQRVGMGDVVSSGCAAIDRLLPAGGYAKGTLVQWLTQGGFGADYLALLAAKEACRDGGALVIVDPLNQFYPPTAAALGIDVGNLIMLRDSRRGRTRQAGARDTRSNFDHSFGDDLRWSIDQALRCPAVGAVWGPLDHLDERWFRRFQLSAESSGCLGLFIQSVSQARQPSWAETQWIVSQCSGPSSQETARTQTLRLQLTRCRGAQTGKTVELMIDAIQGSVGPVR